MARKDDEQAATGATHVSYLTNAMQNRDKHIRIAVNRLNKLRRKGLDFDAIAFTGLSGCLMGAAIADRLGVGMMAVRKPKESCHSTWTSERTPGCSTYIIIDDVVATGETIKHVMSELCSDQCKGIYLYADIGEQVFGIERIQKELKIPCLNQPGKNVDD